jgi:hypothetical protein
LTDNGRVENYPNWFAGTEALDNFAKNLNHFKGQPNLNFLQLGVYTGDATVWLLDNILTDPSSVLTDVDTWRGSDEAVHHSMNFAEIFEHYKDRIAKYPNVYFHRITTFQYLRFHPDDFLYDFIYIDADHTAAGVLLDAELSWNLLKTGGLMAFDDYEWRSGKDANFDPKLGINNFLTRHQGEFKVIHKGWQVWIIKG